MEFMLGYLKVNEMSSVMVMVDRFTKYVVFIPALATCSIEKVVEWLLRHVVKNFRVPEDIMNNQDTPFTRQSWTALFGLLGIELKFSTANHP